MPYVAPLRDSAQRAPAAARPLDWKKNLTYLVMGHTAAPRRISAVCWKQLYRLSVLFFDSRLCGNTHNVRP